MRPHTRRRHLAFIAAALAAPALPRTLRAQTWPTKSIRAVIPFTAGSTRPARVPAKPLGVWGVSPQMCAAGGSAAEDA